MSRKPVIICVDDEKFVLDALLKQLKRQFGDAYEYELAESGEEALEIIKDLITEGQEVVMVISDQIMPGMKGDQLLTYINEQNKKAIKILLTGQASLDSAINSINNADLFRYMTKPWQENDLLLTVGKGIEQYSLKEETLKNAEIFSHFVPKQFLDALSIKSILDVKLGDSVEKEMTIMFSDIRSFTTKSENMTSKENFSFINSYLSYIEPNITKYKGFIDKYIGDAVMALFHSEQEALDSAIAMIKSLKKFNEDFANQSFTPVEIGIGLHTGNLMLGIVGVPTRLQSTVFSDDVNLSSRIESLTKHYGSEIIISDKLYNHLKNKEQYNFRSLGKVVVKGKKDPFYIFEVLDDAFGNKSSLKIKTKNDFEEGIDCYIKANFAEACVYFKRVLETNPEDKAASLYINVAAELIAKPVPKNWEGIIS